MYSTLRFRYDLLKQDTLNLCLSYSNMFENCDRLLNLTFFLIWFLISYWLSHCFNGSSCQRASENEKIKQFIKSSHFIFLVRIYPNCESFSWFCEIILIDANIFKTTVLSERCEVNPVLLDKNVKCEIDRVRINWMPIFISFYWHIE